MFHCDDGQWRWLWCVIVMTGNGDGYSVIVMKGNGDVSSVIVTDTGNSFSLRCDQQWKWL